MQWLDFSKHNANLSFFKKTTHQGQSSYFVVRPVKDDLDERIVTAFILMGFERNNNNSNELIAPASAKLSEQLKNVTGVVTVERPKDEVYLQDVKLNTAFDCDIPELDDHDDLRGFSFYICNNGKVKANGSNPIAADFHEVMSGRYLRLLANAHQADVYIKPGTLGKQERPIDTLICGLSWQDIQALQNKRPVDRRINPGELPTDAVLVYSYEQHYQEPSSHSPMQ